MMKPLFTLLNFLALAALSALAQDATVTNSSEAEEEVTNTIVASGTVETIPVEDTTSIWALVSANDELSILRSLISLVGLESVLQSPTRTLTLFAPRDEAFEELFDDAELLALQTEDNRDTLTDTLAYHVSASLLMSDDLFGNEDMLVFMVNNKSAVITFDDIWWETDIMASNGVIQVIDAVLSPPASPTLVEAVQGSENHNVLAQALENTGLIPNLSGPGNITLFAPTDSAFEMLGMENLLTPDFQPLLTEILLYHVYPGPDLTSTWQVGLSGTMLNGERTSVTSTTPLMINDATVTDPDIFTGNGILQVLDTVLLPTAATSSLMDVLTAASEEYDLSTLIQLVVATGLAETLSDTSAGPFTLFAPTDEAFDEIPTETFAALSQDELLDILNLHVAEGVVTTSAWQDLNEPDAEVVVAKQLIAQQQQPSVTMLNGVSVPISNSLDNDATPRIGVANLVDTDLLAANGVMHIIDSVITPSSLEVFETPVVVEAAEEATAAGKDDDSLQLENSLEDDYLTDD